MASSPGADAGSIQHQYDRGNDFFRLWLDENMIYSCALYDGDDEALEPAQVRKVDFHLHGARATGVDRLLDVGCGWGHLLRRAVDEHGVGAGVGLTLSEAQRDWALAHPHPNVEVRLENWVDHEPAEPYGAIVSIGAIEHFARPEYDRDEKVAAYRQFLEKCHRILVPGGGLSLQSVSYENTPRDTPGAFVESEVFPQSSAPRLAELADAAQHLFEIELVRNDRRHYERTCREWLRRLRAHRDEAEALIGEESYRTYVDYLRLAIYGFGSGRIGLLRLVLRRIDRPAPAS